ncbi:MAG: phosphoribosyltransferase domain-containing protein [Candidatus Competibacteraceae bacterium]|nr:phosphoribosyltransferase domain-containing protein [Candidatus Competibacteraceae bacterium]HRY16637.1 phosphoribosyltransferase domain-containing protein [Candidatus Competibacteraceae bacterium]
MTLRTVTASIQAGCLNLTLRREEWPLDECLTYATRQNPRRLYLFVSKVLGKHWPARPSVMREVHRRLAAKIADLPGPLLVMGMAETATALGRGVAEEVAVQNGRDDVLYLQTTRCRLSRPLAFAFDESHSHAPDHAVYLPEPRLQPLFRTARSLVLVDDEISTGRTLAELARAYLQVNLQVEQIALVSIACWLSAARQRELAALLERPAQFPALIEGEFSFTADPAFPPPALPDAVADAGQYHDAIAIDPARIGVVAGDWRLPECPLSLLQNEREGLTVIGTGEYAYTPFRVALALEEAGYDVLYQSTTRSPILVGDAIASRWEFTDHQGDGIPNYLYNLDADRLPVVIYEHPAMPELHALPNALGGLALAVEEPCRAW